MSVSFFFSRGLSRVNRGALGGLQKVRTALKAFPLLTFFFFLLKIESSCLAKLRYFFSRGLQCRSTSAPLFLKTVRLFFSFSMPPPFLCVLLHPLVICLFEGHPPPPSCGQSGLGSLFVCLATLIDISPGFLALPAFSRVFNRKPTYFLTSSLHLCRLCSCARNDPQPFSTTASIFPPKPPWPCDVHACDSIFFQ